MKGKLQSKAKRVLKKKAAPKAARKSTAGTAKKKTNKAASASSRKSTLKDSSTTSKKATTARAKKNLASQSTPTTEKSAMFNTTEQDPAHSPGHRKMNLKNKFNQTSGTKTQPQNLSALNNMSRADRIQRTSATNRRIITGAALGKTGRVTIKD